MLASVESIRRVISTADGEMTATSLLERFGFTGDRLTARLGDLSGGEQRRFQLLRLLLTEPNVLLLDEPTNDLDIETLNVLEDFLDGWPGHARRGLPRPLLPRARHRLASGRCSVTARSRCCPRGVDEYLDRRAARSGPGADRDRCRRPTRAVPAGSRARGRQRRGAYGAQAARRLDKQLARIAEQEAALNAEIAEHAHDYELLADLSVRLDALKGEKDQAGAGLAEAAELLE